MKTKRFFRPASALALSASFLLALAAVSKADLVYYVTLNVSSLALNPNGAFSLDLQLVPGSINVPNTVTLSNFSITGGTFSGTPDYTFGGQSGSTASSVVLTNSNSQDNEYAVPFSTGVTNIQFKVTQTTNSETVGSGTPIPEQFNVAILDNQLNNIPTTDLSGGNTLVSSAIVFGQSYTSVHTYSSLSPEAGVTASVVPEPGSAGLMLLGACAMIARRKRSKTA